MAETRGALVAKDTPTKKKETNAERVKRRRPFKPPQDRTPFLELPIELRTMVLGYLLTRNKPFHLRGCMRVKDKRVNLSICRANKQLYFEANTVWYGTNTFKLHFPHTDSTMGISNFIKKAGKSCKYLRHIEISYTKSNWLIERGHFDSFGVDCLKSLQSCPHLQSLKISHAMACVWFRDLLGRPDHKTYQQVRAVFDLFELLQKTRQSEGKRDTRSQLIEVIVPQSPEWTPCRRCMLNSDKGCVRQRMYDSCGVDCAQIEEHCTELTTKINDFLSMDRLVVLGELKNRIKVRK